MASRQASRYGQLFRSVTSASWSARPSVSFFFTSSVSSSSKVIRVSRPCRGEDPGTLHPKLPSLELLIQALLRPPRLSLNGISLYPIQIRSRRLRTSLPRPRTTATCSRSTASISAASATLVVVQPTVMTAATWPRPPEQLEPEVVEKKTCDLPEADRPRRSRCSSSRISTTW